MNMKLTLRYYLIAVENLPNVDNYYILSESFTSLKIIINKSRESWKSKKKKCILRITTKDLILQDVPEMMDNISLGTS